MLEISNGEPVKARIWLETNSPVSAIAVGIGFSTREGIRLLTYETDFQDGSRPDFVVPGTFCAEVVIDALPLGPDIYFVDVGARSGDFHGIDYVSNCQQIEVIAGQNTPGSIMRKGSAVRLPSTWSWKMPSASCGSGRQFRELR